MKGIYLYCFLVLSLKCGPVKGNRCCSQSVSSMKSEFKYDVESAIRTHNELYHTEKYTIRGAGNLKFQITEDYREYPISSSYEDDAIDSRFFTDNSFRDPSAPIVVGSEIRESRFIRKNARHSDFDPKRYLDAEFHCIGGNKETACKVDIYLMAFKIPYNAQLSHKGLGCICESKGNYTIENIPEVVFSYSSKDDEGN
eukprot:TCONS_00046956-protein